MYLTKALLFEKTVRRIKEVTLPSGEVARLQSLTELERAEHNAGLLKEDGSVDRAKLKNATSQLLVRMLVDENGEQMLHEHEVDTLLGIDSLVMEILGDAAREHIGWNKDKGDEKNS